MDTEDVGQLVRSAATGDAAAWSSLVQRFSNLVWSVARAHLLSPADAEEVYQITWLRLTEHLGRIKEPDRIAGWLATTARNESLKVIRARARLTVTSDPLVLDRGSEDDSPEHLAIEAEDAAGQAQRTRQVWAAFQRLPERCQQLLRILVSTPAPSYSAIAEMLGMPIGSIGPTRGRCLARMRRLLGGDGPGPPGLVGASVPA